MVSSGIRAMFLSCVCYGCLQAGQAAAQNAMPAQMDMPSGTPAPAAAPGSTQSAPSAAARAQGIATNHAVEEVIVTASRRRERLHDVPGQVGVISGRTLEQLHATTLADFAAFTPGVSFQNTTPATNLIAIRGITTGSDQLNSAIGLYLDDVALGSSTPFGFGSFALNVGTFDLSRVEVLNGPQGTLYGANALGGTLKYVTVPPALDTIGGTVEADGSGTQHGGGNSAIRIALNTPVLNDKVALRVDAVDEYDSGYTTDPVHDRSQIGDSHLYGGRASLMADITPDITARFTGFAQDVDSNGLQVALRDPVTHAPTIGAYEQSFPNAQPSAFSLVLGSAEFDWNLGWAKATSITSYQVDRGSTDVDESIPYSAILGAALGPAGEAPYLLATHAETKRFTQEVRLASPDDRILQYTVGGFYSHEDTLEYVNLRDTATKNTYLLGEIPLGTFLLPSTADDYALFGDVTLHVTPKFDVTAGLRYSWNDQVFSQTASGLVPTPTDPFATVRDRGTSDESVATYLFNARYRFSPQTLVYARIASGFRPGGPNLISGVGTGNATFQPDTLWNYELGVKQLLPQGRGFFNADIYHIDWSQIQLTVNRNGINQLVNGGNAQVNGAEATLSLRVLDQLNLTGSTAITDAKLTTDAPLLGVDYTGARLPLSPNFTLAIAADYTFKLTDTIDGDLNLAFRHIGNRDAGYENSLISPLYRLQSYDLVDLTLPVTTRNGWRVMPYIKNLLDARGEISASTTYNIYVPSASVPVTLTQPRTFGLTVSRSF